MSLPKLFQDLSLTNDFLITKEINQKNLKITLYYYKSLAEIKEFNDHYFFQINENNYQFLDHQFPGIFNPLNDLNIENLTYLLARGNLIIYFNDSLIYSIELSKINHLQKQESHIDPVNVLETVDDLSDLINDNIGLIIKRLKTEQLTIKHFELGSKSKTDCYLLCMKENLEKDYVSEVFTKIKEANDEYYLSINDIAKIFNQNSLIPLSFLTSAPNTICSNLIKGRVVIFLDNTPIACVLPASLTSFSSTKNEVNVPFYYSIINKFLICLFLFLSVFSLSLFVSIMNFQTSIFSPILIANIQVTERGNSFPIFIEILIILFLYEFYRFASSRTPQNFIQNIVIFLGGLVVGQNAVESGTTGSLIIMITSISYLSSFAVTTNPHLVTSLNLFRIFILLFSYFLGLLGFVFGSIAIIVYLISQNSAGKSFLSPFDKVNLKNIINYFIPNLKSKVNDS